MSFPERLVVASRNDGKIAEILRICAEWPVAWLTYREVDLPEVEEAGATYLDNALLKAAEIISRVGKYKAPLRLHDIWRQFIEGV